MRLNRFIGNFDLKQKTLQIFDRDFLHQAKNVLRLSVGEKIVLVDGQGREAIVKITKYGEDFIAAEVCEVKKNKNEPERRIILYCSILKRENFELAVQKSVEAGVREIIPIICQRTVKTGLKYDRLQKIIKEAAEQSGRGIVPIMGKTTNFKKAIADASENNLNILFDSSGVKLLMSDINSLTQQENARAGIFIGPEDGWSEEEINAAKEAGFKIVSFGKLILRAETAAIVGTYLVCNWI